MSRIISRFAGARRFSASGVTLVELMVSMSLLFVVATIASVSYIGIGRSVAKQTGFVDAATQTRQAFSAIDTQVRYADAINAAGFDSLGNQWIEWEVPDPTLTASSTSSQERCFQWEASPSLGQLRYRSWVVPIPSTGTVATPVWNVRLNGLSNGTMTNPVFATSAAALQAAPFALPSPSTGQTVGIPLNEQVGVSLTVSENSPTGRAATSQTFSALNSSAGSSTQVCGQVGRA